MPRYIGESQDGLSWIYQNEDGSTEPRMKGLSPLIDQQAQQDIQAGAQRPAYGPPNNAPPPSAPTENLGVTAGAPPFPPAVFEGNPDTLTDIERVELAAKGGFFPPPAAAPAPAAPVEPSYAPTLQEHLAQRAGGGTGDSASFLQDYLDLSTPPQQGGGPDDTAGLTSGNPALDAAAATMSRGEQERASRVEQRLRDADLENTMQQTLEQDHIARVTQQYESDRARTDEELKHLGTVSTDTMEPWQKVLAVISAAMGGFVGDDTAMKIIQGSIDRNVQTQMTNIDNKRRSIMARREGAQSSAQMEYQRILDEASLRSKNYNQLLAAITAEQSRFSSPEIQAKIGMIAKKLGDDARAAQAESLKNVIDLSRRQEAVDAQGAYQQYLMGMGGRKQTFTEEKDRLEFIRKWQADHRPKAGGSGSSQSVRAEEMEGQRTVMNPQKDGEVLGIAKDAVSGKAMRTFLPDATKILIAINKADKLLGDTGVVNKTLGKVGLDYGNVASLKSLFGTLGSNYRKTEGMGAYDNGVVKLLQQVAGAADDYWGTKAKLAELRKMVETQIPLALRSAGLPAWMPDPNLAETAQPAAPAPSKGPGYTVRPWTP